MLVRRTDLAPGVEAWDSAREGIPVSTVKVLDSRGEEALGKPAGCYVTLTLEGLARREEDIFRRAVQAAAAELSALLQPLPPTPWAPRSTRTCWSPGTWCGKCRSTSAPSAR